MKTIITIAFLLLLAYCNAQFTNQTSAQILSNPQINALVQDGLNQLIALSEPKSQFLNYDFANANILTAAEQAVPGGNAYQIQVDYINTANQIANANLVGFFNTTSSASSVSSLSYTAQPSAFTSIPVDQLFTDDFINGLFDFGFSTTVQNLINSGQIPNGTYGLVQVNNITQQSIVNGYVYNFNVLAQTSATAVAPPANTTVANTAVTVANATAAAPPANTTITNTTVTAPPTNTTVTNTTVTAPPANNTTVTNTTVTAPPTNTTVTNTTVTVPPANTTVVPATVAAANPTVTNSTSAAGTGTTVALSFTVRGELEAYSFSIQP